MLVPGTRRQLARRQVVGGEVRHQADEPIHHARLDALPARSPSPPGHERAGDAEGAVEPGHEVADRHGGAHGLLSVAPVHRHEAAHGLRDEIERRALGVGPDAPVAVDAADHEVWVQLPKARLAESHASEHTGTVVLDQYVGALDEPRQDGLAFLGVQVQRDRPLVPVELREVPRQALDEDALPTDGIPVPRRLDLDDLGAHVGEQHAAEGPGKDAGEVDDADAREGHRMFLLARMVAARAPPALAGPPAG